MPTCDVYGNMQLTHVRMQYNLHTSSTLHVKVIMLHADIIYLACRGQNYETIVYCLTKNISLIWGFG